MSVAQDGMQRLVATALWNGGTDCIALRLPGPAAAGDDAEQLGLASPSYQDLPIGPAAWTQRAGVPTVMVDATAVAKLMGSQHVASAEALFQMAFGIAVSGVLYGIEEFVAVMAEAAPAAYRLTLSRPAWS